MANYLTVRQLVQEFPCFSEASIRYYITNAKENGFDKCINRVGSSPKRKKILINRDTFIEWVDGNK